MQKWILLVAGVVVWGGLALLPAQQQAATTAYRDRCASCHGAGLTGASGPSILSYVRYHTDAEVTEITRRGRGQMPAIPLADDELTHVLSDIRALAGTNPAMATGGYTGSRGGGAGDEPGSTAGRLTTSAAQPAAKVVMNGSPATITLAGGGTRTGVLLAKSNFDATLYADGKFHLLAKEGDLYREKPIDPKRDWQTFDGNYNGNRYSDLDQINTSTVQRLAPAWIFPVPNSERLEVTPVVADGVMYVTHWNELYALDATTGGQLWAYTEPRHTGILAQAGDGANRGASISGDKVFKATDHAHLEAFNRFTGEKVWDVEMASHLNSQSATGAPLPIGDLVISGVAGGDSGARGFVDAYRISNGERAWRFYTIPRRGEPGSETWVGQALEHGCGGTWLTGSYDASLDLIYWGVGNPCPAYTGDERQGDNLYTSSVVALEAKTGRLKWYYQFSPHDTHDWDAVQPMVLVDATWQGQPRKLLMNGNRNGMFYVLDRVTGQFLLGDRLSTKVTWNKGFTKDGKPIIDPGSVSTRDGVAVCPSGSGGANWPGASFNPITKLFYVRVTDGCGIYTSYDDPLGFIANAPKSAPSPSRWFGGGKRSAQAGRDLTALLAGYKGGSFIRAIDPFTGKRVWDYPAPLESHRAGVLTTAGGLAFLGSDSGLVAVNAATGKALWHVNIGQDTASTPMTYMVGGKQYIALPGGVIGTTNGAGVIAAYVLY